VPFLAGSYEYTEPITTVGPITVGANQQDFVVAITPGGFLRGVLFSVTSSGGVLGGATPNADLPWSLINNISLESIDGTPILYPMTGYQHFLASRFFRPWDGDPTEDPSFVSGAANLNGAFNLRVFNESRLTLGALPNTDARAQYRLRFSVASLASIATAGTPTAPAVTVNIALETYAQPPAQDYAGNSIAQLPDGLVLQRFISREIFASSGGTLTVKSNRVGNLIRGQAIVVRGATGNRVDLSSGPIRVRLDNTQLINENLAHRIYENNRVFQFGEFQQLPGPTSASARPAGVYIYPRYHNPGSMQGMYWLPTTEASFLAYELNGTPASGTIEVITEDLAPLAAVPGYLQGI
jgi:hypothetical protein